MILGVFKVDGFYYAARKDLGVGGWGPGNPYGVRIEKSVQNIGPSLRERSLLKCTKGMEEFSDSAALKSCPPPQSACTQIFAHP